MSAPPKTVLAASPGEEAAIRAAVRGAEVSGLGRVLAAPEHAEALAELLSDPAVSDPIYDLPRPFTRENVEAWIAACEAGRVAGECLLMVTFDEAGVLSGYSKVTVWPDRSSAEVGGAVRADRQSSGQGSSGAGRLFGWVFETLGVRLMGLTAATDNIRSARLIDAAGFTRKGERDSIRPDGSVRRSLYWEMAREDWERRHLSGG